MALSTSSDSTPAPPSQKTRGWLLALLIVFSLSGVFDHSLWTPNDAREGAMIAEMFRSGRFAALFLNGEPFLEKPPLLHWTGLLFCAVSGRVNPGIVRLPAVLFGLATALIVWVWGRRAGSERAGIAAAFLCATNLTYYEYSRIVLTDISLTFMVTAALFAFWSAYAARSRRGLRFALFLVLAVLSFYAKGLAGPVFIMGSAVLFLIVSARLTLAAALTAAFVPLLFLAITPWALALFHSGGSEYLIRAFIDNQLGRFLKLPPGAPITAMPLVGRYLGFMAGRPIPLDPYFVHKQPIYHYLVKLPVRLLPWTLLVVPALWGWWKRGSPMRGTSATLLRCTLATLLIVLHASSSKAGSYALPAFPALFLMVGLWFESEWSASGLDRAVLQTTSWLVRAIGIAVPAVYLVGFASPPGFLARIGVHTGIGDPCDIVHLPGERAAWFGALLCLAALAVSIWSIRAVSPRSLIGVAATLALVTMITETAIMPAFDRQRSYATLALTVRDELQHGRPIALATENVQFVALFGFYAERTLPLVTPVPGAREFLDAAPNAAVIVESTDLPAVTPTLSGLDYRVIMAREGDGANSRRFSLVARNP